VLTLLGAKAQRYDAGYVGTVQASDGRPASVGIQGRVCQPNAPTLLNALYNKHQFWDGRITTLEQQAPLPITNPFEMGSASIGDAVSRIVSDKDYRTQFMQAFGRGVNEQDTLSAIAAYERTLASFDSRLDDFLAGEANVISDSAKRGWKSFNAEARLPPLPCFDRESTGCKALYR
jgi:cytochrome c peroxidase